MKVNLAIRNYSNGVLESDERMSVEEEELGELLPKLAEQHATQFALTPGMVEIEFLDEPDETQRFFRIGTDPSGMVQPLAVKLD